MIKKPFLFFLVYLFFSPRLSFATSPHVQYQNKFFDCSPNINWCYAFTTIKDDDGWYKTWFFAPANKTYYPNALECIYLAKSEKLEYKSWEVYSGNKYTSYPYKGSSGTPTKFKPVICHDGPSYMTGDPTVLKINNQYYLLYSMYKPNESDPGSVYAATSSDGISWTGLVRLWEGHRPTMIIDNGQIKVWYDIARQPNGRKIITRTLSLDNLPRFLTSSAWSSTTDTTLTSANTEIIKINQKYTAVTDWSQGAILTIAHSTSDDGINFTYPETIVHKNDLPSPKNTKDNVRGITVPQLFFDNDHYYIIGNIMTTSRHLNQAYFYKIDPLPTSPTIPPTSVCSTCPQDKPSKSTGNSNCDTKINLVDFNAWLQVYKKLSHNQSPTSKELSSVDFNCQPTDLKNTVNLQDFAVWLNSYRQTL